MEIHNWIKANNNYKDVKQIFYEERELVSLSVVNQAPIYTTWIS